MRGYAKNVDSQQIGSVPSPPPRFRGGHTCLWEKGLGKPNSYEGKYTVHGTLYTLYMHFCGSHCSKVCTTMQFICLLSLGKAAGFISLHPVVECISSDPSKSKYGKRGRLIVQVQSSLSQTKLNFLKLNSFKTEGLHIFLIVYAKGQKLEVCFLFPGLEWPKRISRILFWSKMADSCMQSLS